MILNPYLIIIILGLSLSLHQLFHKIYLKKNLIDQVNDRSSHISSATRSGGLSVFVTIFLVSLYYYISGYTIFDFSIIIPLALLTFVGLYDDMYNVDFKLKFVFQIIAAKIIVDNGLIIDNLHGVMGLYEINRIIANLLLIFLFISSCFFELYLLFTLTLSS